MKQGIDNVGVLSLQDMVNGAMSAPVAPWYLTDTVGLGDLVAAYQAIGSVANYAASQINLVNPGTYDLVDLAVPHLWNSVNGWGYDAIPKYFDTQIFPVGNTYSYLIRVTGLSAVTNTRLFGVFEGTVPRLRVWIFNIPTLARTIYINSDTGQYNHPVQLTDGVFGVTPTDAFYNGAKIGALANVASARVPTTSLQLGAQNGGNVRVAGHTQLFLVANRSLTDPEMADLSAQMAAV